MKSCFHPRLLSALLPAALILALPGPTPARSARHHLPAEFRRIVFVGDSITDGDTYPLLIQQALAEAGYDPPTVINAGVASDTAALMHARLDRDVFPHHPTLVTLSAGINDGLRGVTLDAYRQEITAIADRLRQEKIPLLLLTTSVYGPKHSENEANLALYNSFLHDLARQYGLRIAEVNRLQQEARAAGKEVMEEDNVHPNFLGQSLMARAVLDAMGYADVPLPTEFKPALMPGIITVWSIRPTPDKAPPLDENSALNLQPDAAWKTLALPQTDTKPTWWSEQERKRGLAQDLDKLIGPSSSFQGLAYVSSKGRRKVYFNTGAQLHSIWLNGKRIDLNEAWTGWHPGKERIPAELQSGRNTIAIETGSAFFLSITGDDKW
ncbi:MAG: GDSL-type esterase/lipase family protein [Armatimonadota bacterium]|nr:GDSL-type esterase/lipase family protein [Armatimonadota bacterium]